MTPETFRGLALQNPNNARMLDLLEGLPLDHCYLVAGCLFQTIWNIRSNRRIDHGVKDYDVFYFDDGDLSKAGEERLERQVGEAVRDLDIAVDVKNQARVHLWYAGKFGSSYPRLKSVHDGMDRFLVRCTCVGISAADRSVYAPYGLDELDQGILRMNAANPRPRQFLQKAESYRERWPWLRIASER